MPPVWSLAFRYFLADLRLPQTTEFEKVVYEWPVIQDLLAFSSSKLG